MTQLALLRNTEWQGAKVVSAVRRWCVAPTASAAATPIAQREARWRATAKVWRGVEDPLTVLGPRVAIATTPLACRGAVWRGPTQAAVRLRVFQGRDRVPSSRWLGRGISFCSSTFVRGCAQTRVIGRRFVMVRRSVGHAHSRSIHSQSGRQTRMQNTYEQSPMRRLCTVLASEAARGTRCLLRPREVRRSFAAVLTARHRGSSS